MEYQQHANNSQVICCSKYRTQFIIINCLKTIIKRIVLMYRIYRNSCIFSQICILFHIYKLHIYFLFFLLKIQLAAICFSNITFRGARNFKYFYAIAGIGRFESSETILHWDVLTRISRKFRDLHCVRIYRLTCTAIPVGFSMVNSSVDRNRSQTGQIQR